MTKRPDLPPRPSPDPAKQTRRLIDAGQGNALGSPAQRIGVGAILDGKYRLEEVIGNGGFGMVYKGIDLRSKTVIAAKILHNHLLASEEMVRRFEIEGMTGCRVKHPNAVALLDSGITATRVPYLVMEYLQGITLEEELSLHGILPFPRSVHIISAVCDVLIHAHAAGLVHRDIKPANIHLSRNNGAEMVKVLDFGLAKFLEGEDAPQISSGENVIGTPQFMAPERLLGKQADRRADVYSLGATLYLMLTGSLPFGLSTESLVTQAFKQLNSAPIFVQRLRPDLPDELAVLLMRTIAYSRRDRPSLYEIKQQLLEWTHRWQEAWPPASQSTDGAPLELEPTANLGTLGSRVTPMSLELPKVAAVPKKPSKPDDKKLG